MNPACLKPDMLRHLFTENSREHTPLSLSAHYVISVGTKTHTSLNYCYIYSLYQSHHITHMFISLTIGSLLEGNTQLSQEYWNKTREDLEYLFDCSDYDGKSGY